MYRSSDTPTSTDDDKHFQTSTDCRFQEAHKVTFTASARLYF